MLSHLLPYVVYVAPPALAPFVPEPARPWIDPVRVAAAGAALLWFARRGAYPELRRGSPVGGDAGAGRGAAAATLLALGAGLAVALVWMPLAALVPSLGGRGGFDPAAAGEGARAALWASRLLGFVLVIPFAEELLVRSLVPRWVDGTDAWRDRPVGVFTPVSAAVSVVFFVGTHPEWLAALVTAGLWTGLLVRTRRLGDAVLAHAVANGLLAAAWIASGDLSWW